MGGFLGTFGYLSSAIVLSIAILMGCSAGRDIRSPAPGERSQHREPGWQVTARVAFEAASRENTREAYETFLRAHPDGPWAEHATRRLLDKGFRLESSAYKRRSYSDFTDVLQHVRGLYRGFGERFPGSPLALESESRLRRLASMTESAHRACLGFQDDLEAELRSSDIGLLLVKGPEPSTVAAAVGHATVIFQPVLFTSTAIRVRLAGPDSVSVDIPASQRLHRLDIQNGRYDIAITLLGARSSPAAFVFCAYEFRDRKYSVEIVQIPGWGYRTVTPGSVWSRTPSPSERIVAIYEDIESRVNLEGGNLFLAPTAR